MRISRLVVMTFFAVSLSLPAKAFQTCPGGATNELQYNNGTSCSGVSSTATGGLVYIWPSSMFAPGVANATNVTSTLGTATTNPWVALTNSVSATYAPTLPVNAGTGSASSGVTNPSIFFSSYAGIRQLEAYANESQGSGAPVSGNAFLNAQIDWFLNRSAGPPVYTVGPLYNWNGAGSAPTPGIWEDQEGPYGLAGGVHFPNWGPATPSQFQTCLGLTSVTSGSWPTCQYMANILSTATGSLHVGHFNPGLQTFVGYPTPAPGPGYGIQAGTSSPVDSFTYAYTDIPYGNVQNLKGLQIDFTYLTGGQNYASYGQTTNLQDVNAMAIDLEVPTAAQGGGTLGINSNHYTIGDNFIHADRGICNGVSSTFDQGCGLLIGGIGESSGVFYSQVSNSTPDPQYYPYGGDGRTTLQLTSPPVDVLPGDSLLAIDYSAPYTAGNISSVTTPSTITYTSCTVGGVPESCTSSINTTGVVAVSSTDPDWPTHFGGSYTTYISAAMPNNHQQNPANGACVIGSSFNPSDCGCTTVDTAPPNYSSIAANSPNTYPSGPMCIQVSSTSGFSAGQDIRIADQTCIDDTQILAVEPYTAGPPAVPAHLIIASARCQHGSTTTTGLLTAGQTIVATGPASGLALAAGNDTWSAADTNADPVEVWMPVVYSGSPTEDTFDLYVWQDNNKYSSALGPFPYRGRAYTNSGADIAPPSSGCIGSPVASGASPYGIASVPFPLTTGCGGTYNTGDAFHSLTISGCSTPPSVYFGNSTTTPNEAGSIMVADPGTNCTGTLTVSISGDVPNPYQLAPAVMTTSVYQPGVSAFSSTAPYAYSTSGALNSAYMLLDANPYAPCHSGAFLCSDYELTTYSYPAFSNSVTTRLSITSVVLTPNPNNAVVGATLPSTVRVNISTTPPIGFAAGWYVQLSGVPGIPNKPVLVTSVSSGYFTYTLDGVTSSETITASSMYGYVGGLIKQAHYQTQNVNKDAEFAIQQFNAAQTNGDLSTVSYNGNQGNQHALRTMFSVVNSVDNSVVVQLPGLEQPRGSYLDGIWNNYGTSVPMAVGERIEGPFHSNIYVNQPPSYSNNQGAVIDVGCNTYFTYSPQAPCQLMGPAGSGPFYMWRMTPPQPRGSESYIQLQQFGLEMDLPNNMMHSYLNGLDMIDYYAPVNSTGAPTPAEPTLFVNYNGSAVSGNTTSGATIGISQGAASAVWGVSSAAPSSSCLAGSLWSDTNGTTGDLYACKAGTGWIAVGSGGSGGCPTCTGSLAVTEDSGTGTVAPVPPWVFSSTYELTGSGGDVFGQDPTITVSKIISTMPTNTVSTQIAATEDGGGISFTSTSGSSTWPGITFEDGSFVNQSSGGSSAEQYVVTAYSSLQTGTIGCLVYGQDGLGNVGCDSNTEDDGSGDLTVASVTAGGNPTLSLPAITASAFTGDTGQPGIIAYASDGSGGMDGEPGQPGMVAYASTGAGGLGGQPGQPGIVAYASASSLETPGQPGILASGSLNQPGLEATDDGSGGGVAIYVTSGSILTEYAVVDDGNGNSNMASYSTPDAANTRNLDEGDFLTVTSTHYSGYNTGAGGAAPQPIATPELGAGTGGTATVDSNASDFAFTLTVTVGTSPGSSTEIAYVTFGTSYANTPHCVWSAGNGPATGALLDVTPDSGNNATVWGLDVGSPLVSGHTYVWTIICAQ